MCPDMSTTSLSSPIKSVSSTYGSAQVYPGGFCEYVNGCPVIVSTYPLTAILEGALAVLLHTSTSTVASLNKTTGFASVGIVEEATVLPSSLYQLANVVHAVAVLLSYQSVPIYFAMLASPKPINDVEPMAVVNGI